MRLGKAEGLFHRADPSLISPDTAVRAGAATTALAVVGLGKMRRHVTLESGKAVLTNENGVDLDDEVVAVVVTVFDNAAAVAAPADDDGGGDGDAVSATKEKNVTQEMVKVFFEVEVGIGHLCSDKTGSAVDHQPPHDES